MRYVLVGVVLCAISLCACSLACCDEGVALLQSILAKPSEPGKPYTSLIIDTSGMTLQRCMSPKIRRADGSEVWGTVKVDYDFLEEHGLVAYVGSLEDAKKSSRCGSNPMIVKAIAILGGKCESDPVIAGEDATLLLAENDKGKFLGKLNVIFIQAASQAPRPAQ